jgi:hypothetical protein
VLLLLIVQPDYLPILQRADVLVFAILLQMHLLMFLQICASLTAFHLYMRITFQEHVQLYVRQFHYIMDRIILELVYNIVHRILLETQLLIFAFKNVQMAFTEIAQIGHAFSYALLVLLEIILPIFVCLHVQVVNQLLVIFLPELVSITAVIDYTLILEIIENASQLVSARLTVKTQPCNV